MNWKTPRPCRRRRRRRSRVPCARDGELPSLDDWNSCGFSCGKTALGIMCHDILASVVEHSLPNWSSMDVPVEGQGGRGSGPDEQRKRNQRKAWRTKKVLLCETRRLNICSMAFLASPLESLQEELTHGDSTRGKRLLLDVFEETNQNPFYTCRRRLCRLMDSGDVFDCLYPHFSRSFTRQELLSHIRELGLDFGGQVFWRFRYYLDFPFLFARWADRTAPPQQRQEVEDLFYDLQPCCRGKEFTQKVFDMFPTRARQSARRQGNPPPTMPPLRPTCHPRPCTLPPSSHYPPSPLSPCLASPHHQSDCGALVGRCLGVSSGSVPAGRAALAPRLNSVDGSVFRDGINALVRSWVFTNMCSERLLAQMRHACKQGDVERVCSSGFLAQILTEHKRLDRDDPCYVSRARLLEDGVPIRAQGKDKKWSRAASGFVHWMGVEQAKRKKESGPLAGTAYLTWKAGKILEWHGLPDARKEEEGQKAEARHAAAQAAEADGQDDGPGGHGVGRGVRDYGIFDTFLMEVGDERQPFKDCLRLFSCAWLVSGARDRGEEGG